MTNKAKLQAYVSAFENLTPQSLETDLAPLFANKVFFKDPFNAVTGKQATLAIFKHMFKTVSYPKFTVTSAAVDGDIGLLHWQFNFVLKSNQSQQQIEGMSRIRFDSQGLVSEHIDYWDAGEQVYSKVPLLGWSIRQINKRLTASKL